MIQITDAQIHNLSQIYNVSKNFVIEIANKVDTMVELEEILYNNTEYSEKFNLDKELIEDAQMYKLQIEKENDVKLDFGKPIKVELKVRNHECIFNNFSKDEKPCSICPLHEQMLFQLTLDAIKENEMELTNENIQKIYDELFDFFIENKDRIVSDITKIIEDNKSKF